MENLFVYGTLKNHDVQNKVIGRIVNGKPDSLRGFRKSLITLNNKEYPIIIEDQKSTRAIEGLVSELSEEELKKTDEYEGDAYRRQMIMLNSGLKAWVYTR